MKTYQKFISEKKGDTVIFTFGRFNPPTVGHEKLITAVQSVAKSKGGDFFVYPSHSQDPKKNPLSQPQKIKYMKKMFPKYKRNIVASTGKTALAIASELYSKGYTNLVMVVGSDRVQEFQRILDRYNGEDKAHGFYDYDKIEVVSAGERDPDAEGVAGMSASKQRANAKENDYTAFSQGVPKNMNDKDTRKLFNDVRKGMGLKEEKKFKRHVDLGKLNELRENYVKGSLYEIGDTVVIKESEEVGIITVLGSNYVIIETNDKKKVRKWLDAIELVEKKLTPAELKKREEIAKAIEKDNPKMPMDKKMAIATATAKRVAEKIVDDVSTIIEKEKEKARVAQDKDVKDKKGSQPSVYYKGVAKKTKSARASHFAKHGKMDDDNPAAYKDAPGDKKARKKGTKLSKHTKSYKQMFGDD